MSGAKHWFKWKDAKRGEPCHLDLPRAKIWLSELAYQAKRPLTLYVLETGEIVAKFDKFGSEIA